jgi:hydrogenase/urease accessory protein HupE
MSSRSRRHALASVALLVALTGVPVFAHPLAATTVAIAVSGSGVLDVSISAHADPLIEKLEALAGLPPSEPRQTRDDRAARLRQLGAALLTHIDLRVDDARASLTVRDVIVDATAQAEIRLTAAFPADVRHMTWRSTFIYGSYPVAVRDADGMEAVEWLQGPQMSGPISLNAPRAPLSVARGLAMGFTHIVPTGLDHILFVLGLFLLSRRTREVLLQVTAFTLAHSVTLGLSLYGLVSAPASIVEPLIALSVAYVGVENLMTRQLHPWRVAVVFAFGLLHGMGFAEALADLRLSPSSLVAALVSFNVGVEAGQLTVIAAAAGAFAFVSRVRAAGDVGIARLASAAIGLMGAFWTIQRLI